VRLEGAAELREALRIRQFRLVWAGESLSLLGDTSYVVAFAWLVLTVSDSATTLAFVLLATGVPRGAFLLLGGVVTDRLSARSVMFVSHLVRGSCVLTLGILSQAGAAHIWQFYVVGFVFGVADGFFEPASSSVLPTLVPEHLLLRANALIGFGEQIALLAGPILGGVLVATAGPATVMFVDAATFAMAATLLTRIPRAATISGALRARVLDDLKGGLTYALRDPETRIVLLYVSAATLTYSGIFAVGLPALAKTFPEGSVALGVLISASGAGQLLGTIGAAFTGLPSRWGLLIIGLAICEGTAFATIALAPSLWLAAALLATLGVGVAYSTDVALPLFVQTRTPPALLGRVNSIITLPRAALAPVSLAAMGVLAAIDVRLAFALAGLPLLLLGVGLACTPRARALSMPPRRLQAP
jgi:MFS family permease